MKVLIVEDDFDTADFIKRGLEQNGDTAHHVGTAQQGMVLATSEEFDVIIFDRLLPKMDGIDAVRILRGSNVVTPIIMLTALSETADRVSGLDAGADDYLVKPFDFSELYARLKALTRRTPLKQEALLLNIADLRLERTARRVSRGGQALDLNPKEYQILEYLMLNPGQLVTKTMLLEKVWGFNFDPKTSLVQTHVSRLRNKVDKPFDTELIKTIRGCGYIISDHD
ncbi:response regulator transcription factor [Pseudoalteromonas luteoviolacea]|uniref:response regulator transcription factor n=1 Tax=Pseudoalteromonas luteoviolacea TaxID=43657 RepID=UPI001B35A46C|nr:response regulator transcription factor [Pseudoalteromonas luteoviolacea]MBQ4810544.1 response regulator transcription factor [Pseudoalteromonas luteoviolacea]